MITLEDSAKQAAGNWQKFEDFCWYHKGIRDPKKWYIHRLEFPQSKLITKANAQSIRKVLSRREHLADVRIGTFDHWLSKTVDVLAVRVFSRGWITFSYKTFYSLMQQLENSVVLDEGIYSELEYKATCKNIESIGWKFKEIYRLPDNWTQQVWKWLWENRPETLQNKDDEGGCPDQDHIHAAIQNLGFKVK